jgi:hypothetical protein
MKEHYTPPPKSFPQWVWTTLDFALGFAIGLGLALLAGSGF